MLELPLVLTNKVTQYLHDSENGQFLTCAKGVGAAVRAAPRESMFTVTGRTGDMYGRYRQVHACVGPEHIYTFYVPTDCMDEGTAQASRYQNAEHEYTTALRRVSEAEVWHVVDFIAQINANDLHVVRFSWNEDDAPLYKITDFQLEVMLALERLDKFTNVHTLDAAKWRHFRALGRFPNISTLAIRLPEGGAARFPALPNLTDLRISNSENFDNDDDPLALDNFPVWPTVHTIQSVRTIPAGYTALRHVTTCNLMVIPAGVVAQLESITTEIDAICESYLDADHVWSELDEGHPMLKLDRCVALRQLTIVPTIYCNMVIMCSKHVKLTYPSKVNIFHKEC